MSPLVSPQALLPPIQLTDSAAMRLVSPPPIYCNRKELNISYARLRSPPPSESSPRPPSALSKPSCSPTACRRSKAPSHSSRRRRKITTRVDYRTEHPPLHAFDKLPWIASLDMAPDDNVHPWDIADLSLLPDPMAPHIQPSGPGPVRRRKVSPRSSPMVSLTDVPPDDHPLDFPLSPRDTLSRPSTPPPRFDSSRVTFRHLMPVNDGDVSYDCITSSTDL